MTQARGPARRHGREPLGRLDGHFWRGGEPDWSRRPTSASSCRRVARWLPEITTRRSARRVIDKSQIASFHDKQPKMVMRTRVISDQDHRHHAHNTERHKERAHMTFEKDAMLYGAFIHAHYRGNGPVAHYPVLRTASRSCWWRSCYDQLAAIL